MVKTGIITGIGAIGSFIASLYGGWTSAMTTLCVFMLIDYITGLICAGVFKKSIKTEDGGLESKAGFKGLARKFAILLLVLVACRIDITLGTTYVRDTVIIAFIANETISIVENIGLMGVPLPSVITKAITLLNEKGGITENGNGE